MYSAYMVVRTDYKDDPWPQDLDEILAVLEFGYKVVSAVAVRSRIHYILAGSEPLPKSVITNAKVSQ